MPTHDPTITFRRARIEDRDALREMQALSLRILGRGFYTPAEIESIIAHMGTMDDFLLHEGTYYLAEAEGRVVASGGWSRRRPNYATLRAAELPAVAHGDGAADVTTVMPKVRSVFVHPAFARRGLARALMCRAEFEAWRGGFRAIELTATRSGERFYRALGYGGRGELRLSLADGTEVRFVPMRKQLRLVPETPVPLLARA